jgi:hypothetical protein
MRKLSILKLLLHCTITSLWKNFFMPRKTFKRIFLVWTKIDLIFQKIFQNSILIRVPFIGMLKAFLSHLIFCKKWKKRIDLGLGYTGLFLNDVTQFSLIFSPTHIPICCRNLIMIWPPRWGLDVICWRTPHITKNIS